MNVGLYQAASALNAADRWQEIIAENLASSAIPGFKKQELTFQAVAAGSIPSTSPSGVTGPGQSISLPYATASTSFTPGQLRYTASDTDVAIEGNAFFEVQLPNGSTAYTRDGEFHISAQGLLVTKQGFPVLGDGGPIQIDVQTGAKLAIAASGEVSQGVDQKGRIRLTEIDDPRRLTQISGGMFLANEPGIGIRPSTSATVRQGWLEGSNTTAVAEMANLITAMRTFEANQRVVQLQDERMGKTITELATS